MKDTICAIATLVGESSINVIRISGDDSISIVNKLFNKDLTKKSSYTITYGFIVDGTLNDGYVYDLETLRNYKKIMYEKNIKLSESPKSSLKDLIFVRIKLGNVTLSD